jgi:predicted transcriptional regulator
MSQSMTVRIPDDLRKRLLKASRSEGKAASDIVRESLKRYLLLAEFRGLRDRAIPYAEARGVFTDEDVFERIS